MTTTPGILRKRYGANWPQRLAQLVIELKTANRIAYAEQVAPNAIRQQLLKFGYRAEYNPETREWIWVKPELIAE